MKIYTLSIIGLIFSISGLLLCAYLLTKDSQNAIAWIGLGINILGILLNNKNLQDS